MKIFKTLLLCQQKLKEDTNDAINDAITHHM